jgi:hypothetical protein
MESAPQWSMVSGNSPCATTTSSACAEPDSPTHSKGRAICSRNWHTATVADVLLTDSVLKALGYAACRHGVPEVEEKHTTALGTYIVNDALGNYDKILMP